MKMIKGNVIKDIPNNLIADYERLGWKEYKEEIKKPSEKDEKISFKSIKK